MAVELRDWLAVGPQLKTVAMTVSSESSPPSTGCGERTECCSQGTQTKQDDWWGT
jgi:hypothetical protein